MASKGKGKGKGLSKKFDIESQKKLIAQKDGSLDKLLYIQAEFEKDRWIKARILECRLAKGKNNLNMEKGFSFPLFSFEFD
jgi:hypothetical protein